MAPKLLTYKSENQLHSKNNKAIKSSLPANLDHVNMCVASTFHSFEAKFMIQYQASNDEKKSIYNHDNRNSMM